MSVSFFYGISSYLPQNVSLAEKAAFIKSFSKLKTSSRFLEWVDFPDGILKQFASVEATYLQKVMQMQSTIVPASTPELKEWHLAPFTFPAEGLADFNNFSVSMPNFLLKRNATPLNLAGIPEGSDIGSLDVSIQSIKDALAKKGDNAPLADLLKFMERAASNNWIVVCKKA